MKKHLATSVIALGAALATCGLIGTPAIQDLLPVDFALPTDDQATHQYLRVVPTASQITDYLPYVLMVAGVLLLKVGVGLRRRLRGTAA